MGKVDSDKEQINVIQLFTKKEFLVQLFIFPMIVNVIVGIGGVYFSLQGVDFRPQAGIPLIGIGYLICFIFALIAAKSLYSENILYTIQNPRTIIWAQGLSYFISYFVSYTFSLLVLTTINIDHPNYLLIDESIVYYAGNQLVAWILGGFIIIYAVLIIKVDYNSKESQKNQRYTQNQQSQKKAEYVNPISYSIIEEGTYERVSFKQASELLDSDTYNRGTKMSIEFECEVLTPPSPEKIGGPAPYRTIQVTDPSHQLNRTLYIWGGHGYRYNIDLVSSLKLRDRILVSGPRRPKDSSYYKDSHRKDVFWIEQWNGNSSRTGTRLKKLESQPTEQIEFHPPDKKDNNITQKIEKRKEPSLIPTIATMPPFYCQICSIKHKADTPRMQCDSCSRYICVEAFADMARVKRTNCPMCEGKLTAV